MTSPHTNTTSTIASIWERNLPVLRARLDLLQQAAAADPLPEALRVEAEAVAHKLAGSLGMFGYMDGTRIARELEVLLGGGATNRTRLGQLTEELRITLFGS